MKNLLRLLSFTLAFFHSVASGQNGTFDNLILDGGSNTGVPYVLLFNGTRLHYMSGFEDRIGF